MLQGGDGASSRALPTGKGSFQKHLKIVWTLPWARPKCGSTGECTNSTGNAFMGLARVSCSEQSPFTGIIPSLSSATPRAAPSPAGQLSAHCAHCAVRTQPGCPVTHSGCDLWCHSCHSSTAQLSLASAWICLQRGFPHQSSLKCIPSAFRKGHSLRVFGDVRAAFWN